MPKITTWLEQDLQSPVQVKVLNGYVFSRDSQGNKVGVIVTDGGEPVELSGTVYGYVIKSDGSTVNVAGAIEDYNRAYFIMPQEAYVVGNISIVIKITNNTEITTLAACTAYVYESRTTSEVVPTGTPIPDLSTLNDAITAAQTAATAANTAASNALGNFAGAFSASSAYSAGTFVTYTDGKLYLLPNGHEANVTWANTTKTEVTVGSQLSDLKSAMDKDVNALYYDEFLVNAGQYTIQKTDLESGAWANGYRQSNTARGRIKYLFHVRSGMTITYSNANQTFDLFFGVYNQAGTSIQSIGWKTDQSGTISITKDGNLAFMIRDHATSGSATVDVANYDTTVVIVTDIKSKLLTDEDTIQTIQSNLTSTDSKIVNVQTALLSEIVESSNHYESSRITNNTSLATNTQSEGGVVTNSPGRCVTYALNGSLYPIDAVYISSGDYCIRMFGYTSDTTIHNTCLGHTDWVVGGKDNIIYRPDNWITCRVVIARNPTTDTTEFTTAEIEDIAEKLTILKYTDDYGNLGLHEKPKSRGVINVIKRARQLSDIKWIPETNIPRVASVVRDDFENSESQRADDVFLAETEYTGLPYTGQGFVGFSVGITTFMTAMFNSSKSIMKDSRKLNYYTASKYGAVCTTFVSYSLNLPIVSSAYYDQIPDLTLIGTVPSKIDDIQLGDVFVKSSHVTIITDIIRYGHTIKYIEVSEETLGGLINATKQGGQWGGICRRKMWGKEDCVNYFSDFSIYRYAKIDTVPFTEHRFSPVETENKCRENPFVACMPYNGDYSWYRQTEESIKVLILDNRYTSLAVYKDGTLINTYSINSETESVDIPNSGSGYYSAKLTDNSQHESKYCHWMIYETITSSFTVSNGIATFTVEKGIDNTPVYVRFGNSNDIPYVHIVENLTKTYSNGTYTYTFTAPYDGNTFYSYYLYFDGGEYGLLSNAKNVS